MAAFVQWQVQQGYAIGSLNVRLSTVKRYCRLATQAGILSPETYALIATVKGYGHKEGKHIDAKREVSRHGAKKADWVDLSVA